MALSYIAAHDGTARGADAVALAKVLAEPVGASVRIVHVRRVPVRWGGSDGVERAAHRRERERAVAAAEPLRRPGDPLPLVVTAHSAARGLQEVAERERAALVAVGSSHRTPVGRTIAGATAQRLLHGAPCPVAVAPAGYSAAGHQALRAIAIAVDGQPAAWAALRHAGRLAARAGTSLQIITVVDPAAEAAAFGTATSLPVARRRAVRGGELLLREALARVPAGVGAQTSLLVGSPGPELAAACDAGIDLLVCGSRGYGPARAVLLGSVSSHVVTHARCPVLVLARVPSEEAPEPDALAEEILVHHPLGAPS